MIYFPCLNNLDKRQMKLQHRLAHLELSQFFFTIHVHVTVHNYLHVILGWLIFNSWSLYSAGSSVGSYMYMYDQ